MSPTNIPMVTLSAPEGLMTTVTLSAPDGLPTTTVTSTTPEERTPQCSIYPELGSPHAYFDIGKSVDSVPIPGTLCEFKRPDGKSFHGKVTRVVAYQVTRVIVQVEHRTSYGRFTLAVPYMYYVPTSWSVLAWVARWFFTDREGDGMDASLHAGHRFWEIEDSVQDMYTVW